MKETQEPTAREEEEEEVYGVRLLHARGGRQVN